MGSRMLRVWRCMEERMSKERRKVVTRTMRMTQEAWDKLDAIAKDSQLPPNYCVESMIHTVYDGFHVVYNAWSGEEAEA